MEFKEVCPKCKDGDLEYGVIEPIDENFQQKITCNRCGHNFSISTTEVKWEVDEPSKVSIQG